MKTFFPLVLVCVMLATGARTAAGQVLSSPHSHAGVAFNVAPPLGYGVDIAVPVSEKVNVRGGFNAFGISHDFDNDGITLAAQLKLRSVSAHLDWFPFGGGFHLSPGVMLYNGNEVNAAALVPAGSTFDLGDETLRSNPANPVTGTFALSFKKVAPSLRLGWGNIVPRSTKRWSIPFEIGLVYSDSPTAVLNLNGSACTISGTNCRNIATEPQLQADLKKEQDQVNDDLTVLRVIPVISLGFSVKF